MTASWSALPPAGRAVAQAVTDAVEAARAQEPALFADAAARLAALDAERVRVVLGAVVASLLEEVHPDELTGADAQEVLEGCVRSALPWFADVDPQVLVVVLTGALGLHDPQEAPLVGALQVAEHAPLLLAHLLHASRRSLEGHLHAALAELARAETVEMP